MAPVTPNLQRGGIFDIMVPGNWVLPEDQLWLAIVKPPYAGPNLIENDATRPQALALATALFAPNRDGQYPIAINAPVKNAVVLFPEFAFGSDDFAYLDSLIRAQPRPVMVFAGFGAVRGESLRSIVQNGQTLCGWQSGLAAIDAAKRYNAAWCWIHDPRQAGDNSHRCYIFLKNWPEQRHERVGIPDLASGTETLRLVVDDCTIFPLICADILCTAPNSAHERIATSIRANNLDRKMVLIPVLMLDNKPSNPAWISRLANMIQASPLKVAIVTCNHVSVAPSTAEDEDQLRCLSGALVSVQQFSADHPETLHPVRPVNVAGVAGYVLRSTAPGIAGGDFIWRELGLANRFIWLPNLRATLDGDAIVDAIAPPVQVEMQRWCRRVRRPAWLNPARSGTAFLDAGFDKIQLALKPAATAKTLWPEALTGRGLDSTFPHQLDDAGRSAPVRDALDEAFLIAGSVIQAPGYLFEPLANPGHFHRPATGDRAARDIVIWSSPDKLSDHQFKTLQEAALSGRFGRAVVVIANSPGGTPPTFTRVTPEATTDVGNGPPSTDKNDIAEPPPPPVFWMPSGELHTLLASEEWDCVPADMRSASIGIAIENLLNRIAA